MSWRLFAAAAVLLGGCSGGEDRDGIYLQRFFGECGAVYGRTTDVAKVCLLYTSPSPRDS